MSKLPEENCKIYVKYTAATKCGVICVMLHSFFRMNWKKVQTLSAAFAADEELMQNCSAYQEIYYSQFPEEAVLHA